MGKAKRKRDSKPSTVKIGSPRKPSKSKTARAAIPLKDEAEFDKLAGIPDEAQIEKVGLGLAPKDKSDFKTLRQLLAQHLGSEAAARLWLVTPSPEFLSNPLDAVRKGKAKQVLDMLKSQWGRSPTFA